MTQREKLYAERDAMELDEAGNYYIKHVMAMTSEQLHSKSAIAGELAHRDMLIDKLTKELQKAAKVQAVQETNKALLQSLHDMVEIVGVNFCSNQDVKRKYKIARELLEQNK